MLIQYNFNLFKCSCVKFIVNVDMKLLNYNQILITNNCFISIGNSVFYAH